MMGHTNRHMHVSKTEKRDEYYTLYSDIVWRMEIYEPCFRGMKVYCNCDTDESGFVRYFRENYHRLGLAGLVWTHFSRTEPVERSEFDGETVTRYPMTQNGDFRSSECRSILDSCDVVVTNPPFSLATDYADLVIGSGKKYIFMGTNLLVKHRTLAKEFINDRVSVGRTRTHTYFRVPEWYSIEDATDRKIVDGKECVGVAGIYWYSNLGPLGAWPLEPTAATVPDEHLDDPPDVVNLKSIKDIPIGYNGRLAVPVSYLYHHDPGQYRIDDVLTCPSVNGKEIFIRVIIQARDNNETI